MAIRPPRPAPRRRSRYAVRDTVASIAVATAILLFGLRVAMALLGIETWSAAWEIVAVPTDVIVELLQRIDLLADPIANYLTPADLVAFVAVSFAGLTYLASLALRRD